jgi:hypothetical protein
LRDKQFTSIFLDNIVEENWTEKRSLSCGIHSSNYSDKESLNYFSLDFIKPCNSIEHIEDVLDS